MTKSELEKYKNFLEAKQTDLTHQVRNREGIVIKTSPDALDEVQHAAEREMAIDDLVRDSNLLRNVRRALRDIEEGLRRVPAFRGGHQPQTTGSSTLDTVLHSVPGIGRP